MVGIVKLFEEISAKGKRQFFFDFFLPKQLALQINPPRLGARLLHAYSINYHKVWPGRESVTGKMKLIMLFPRSLEEKNIYYLRAR